MTDRRMSEEELSKRESWIYSSVTIRELLAQALRAERTAYDALKARHERLLAAAKDACEDFEDCADHFDDLGKPILHSMAREAKADLRAAIESEADCE